MPARRIGCVSLLGALSNAGVNIHIDPDSLTRHHRKWLGCCTNAPTRPALNVQDVIARRQFNTVFSTSVRGDVGDFCFSVPAQDYEWIVGVVFSGERSWRSIGKLNFPR